MGKSFGVYCDVQEPEARTPCFFVPDNLTRSRNHTCFILNLEG